MRIRGKNLNLGFDCVHVIWLTGPRQSTRLPAKFEHYVKSAENVYPKRKVVEWLNSDADEMVRRWGKRDFFYNVLKTPVERSDLLRMMILHDFGGIYADVDVEFLQPLPVLDKPVNLIKSPLFSENFQSCLMVANTRNHPLWKDVVERIEQNFRFLETHKQGAVVRRLLSNPVTARFARMAITVFLTGPPNIDRCICDQLGGGYAGDVALLPDTCYCGPISVHHEAGSWTVFPAIAETAEALRTGAENLCTRASKYPALAVGSVVAWVVMFFTASQCLGMVTGVF